MITPKLSALTPERQQLLKVMSCLNFGRLEGLHVRHGQPVWDPPPRIVREVKLGGDNSPRPEASAPNFQLKEQVLELFTHIAELGDGVIDVLEVKHGLPFKLEHLKSS